MRPARLRSLCAALLVLDVAYATTAVFVDALPGWKMFAAAEPLDVVVTDRNGAAVDPRAYLPRDAQILDRKLLFQVLAFVCTHDAGRAPLSVTERSAGRDAHLRLAAPRCVPDAAP